jgi:hypothetical protein
VPAPDLITLFIAPLNALGLSYMVTGAVAAVVYGEPRFTRDVDLVVSLRPDDALRLATAFPAQRFYVPPPEVIAEESRRARHGHFNLIHLDTSLKADFYLAGDDPLHAWGMERRTCHDVNGTPVWIAPLEYVVVRKLAWHRDSGASRHLEDIRAMLRVSGDRLDRAAVTRWVELLDLSGEWHSV